MNESTRILYKCIEGRFIKVMWTHKIQECQADIYSRKSIVVKRHITCFTVLTTGSALVSIFPFLEVEWISVITAFLAAVLSYFNMRYGDGLIDKKLEDCKFAAAKLHDLRNRYESLLTDIMAGLLSDAEIIVSRNELREAENILYLDAPRTTSKAVNKASEALNYKKDSVTEEEEIDRLIPPHLVVH